MASTRAKKRLYFTYPLTTGYEHIAIRQPSTFLDEIPAGMVEHVRLRQGQPAWMQYASTHKAPRRDESDTYDEPTIVLDDSGEEVKSKKKPMPPSFLRNIDEL